MSFVPVAGKEGEFLAVQGFLSNFNAGNTSIAWVKPRGERFESKTLLKLPFIHRFDIFYKENVRYILVCTIATSKKDANDWSDPGKLWAGMLPDSLNDTIELIPIKHGLQKNHGYCRVKWDGTDAALISSDLGVMLVKPPNRNGEEWEISTIIEQPISDIALFDLDQDGENEIAVIEPFHGNRYAIYKKIKDQWEKIYQYEKDLTLGHVVYTANIRGIPTAIGGDMQGEGELFYLQCTDPSAYKFKADIIDTGGKPSNVIVLNYKEKDLILAANSCGEAVAYEVR